AHLALNQIPERYLQNNQMGLVRWNQSGTRCPRPKDQPWYTVLKRGYSHGLPARRTSWTDPAGRCSYQSQLQLLAPGTAHITTVRLASRGWSKLALTSPGTHRFSLGHHLRLVPSTQPRLVTHLLRRHLDKTASHRNTASAQRKTLTNTSGAQCQRRELRDHHRRRRSE